MTAVYDCGESRHNVQRALAEEPPVAVVAVFAEEPPVCIGDLAVAGFPVSGILVSGVRREDGAGRREDAASARMPVRVNA